MPNLEPDVAHDLVTPAGTILFNQPDPTTGRWFKIDPAGYKIVPSLRATSDNRSQTDGAILHPRYKTGLVATFKVILAIRQGGAGSVDYVPACGHDLREMNEDLSKALNSIRRLTQNQQRLIWTPSSSTPISRRMLDFVQCLAWPDPEQLQPGVEHSLAFETPLPYGIDLTQQTTSLPATITNPGTSDYDPVLKAHGPFSAFTITNTSVLDEFGNPISIVYDASLPGAQVVPSGHYAEIDAYKGSIFLDGNGADLTAGLDPELTDFEPPGGGGFLRPGANVITSDVSCDVLWNPAWS